MDDARRTMKSQTCEEEWRKTAMKRRARQATKSGAGQAMTEGRGQTETKPGELGVRDCGGAILADMLLGEPPYYSMTHLVHKSMGLPIGAWDCTLTTPHLSLASTAGAARSQYMPADNPGNPRRARRRSTPHHRLAWSPPDREGTRATKSTEARRPGSVRA